jgi:NNP family nitrate/nitrite transporter-like MFS transporter
MSDPTPTPIDLNTINDPKAPPGKAKRITLFQFNTPQMRAFHMSWFAFFLCFLAWFGLAPFMPQIRSEMSLSPDQVKWAGIAAVGITFFARLGFGRLCDAIGPRLTYSILLVVGSVPVMCVGLAHSYPAFLVARLLIGIIGASFVITQYHTSMMFAPNVVGTANAMTGGWGNMGGGFTQQIMPVVAGWAMAAGVSKAGSWRVCMLGAGIVCLLTGVAYFFMTQDTPGGNLIALRREGKAPPGKPKSFSAAAADLRTWCLFLLYGSCFGIELTIDNNAHLYFHDYFRMDLRTAGWIALSFGGLNLFARGIGGFVSDRLSLGSGGLNSRAKWLFGIVFLEGLTMMLFAQMHRTGPMVAAFIAFGLCVCMSCGATYAIVPFVNRRAVGSVSGIVGAGGNAAAVAAGFLFGKGDWHHSLFLLGAIVTGVSFLAWGVRFSAAEEAADAPLQPPAHPVVLEPTPG